MNSSGAGVVLIIAIVLVVFYIIEKITRKWLKVSSKVAFVVKSVNDKHRKIDWTLRAIFMFGIFFLAIMITSEKYQPHLWLYIFFSYLLITNVILELVRAFMQKRYSEEKNEYIVTLIQLVLFICLAMVTLTTKFFGFLI
ncbi:DUF4181 domain-containing protein [Sporosarcina aquimarina]|uniref:DUF4181 domain-containing protein n=1 Tax=Sporosarcina aquimarina TaxID=114975 RepID=A0ABU4G2R6_9BACL|nr:DUF4181 domain-containing protein [Sporosarcina aquimarina]MDW0111264.1 DUF4181 domain-containing protein [Sporosarcina aquimarina]